MLCLLLLTRCRGINTARTGPIKHSIGGDPIKMLFKPILALVLLATVISGRRLNLNELLKRVTDEVVDPDDVPQTKVQEFTGRAVTAHNPGRASEKVDASRAKTMVARTLAASSGSNVAEHLEVLGEMRNLIVDLHNQHRATVMPPATDMETMKWDDDVAQYAADWAQCGEHFFQHREGANRIRSYGENLYISMNSGKDPVNMKDEIEFGLNAWWEEKEDYDFRSNSCEAGKKCGHYTQMAWAKSNRIGCGYALNCPIEGKPQYTSSFYLVCNYSPPGNFNGMKPYTVEQTSGPAIWTFGGTGKGANCLFPFTHEGTTYRQCIEVYPGELPWCKTDNGKWGYCAPVEVLSEGPCKDTLSYCQYYKKAFGGTCPNWRYLERRCAATCNFCSCAVQECQNGGTLEACACKCAGAWTGGDCGVCLISECKNGGVFDRDTCTCACPEGYGAADCGCVNNAEPFDNHGRKFKCAYGWIKKNNLCRCPKWGPALKENCPVTCGTCPIPGMNDRE
ncbi:hypothetical protein LSAT2_006797 [Lamellibrachia satsuma]|nr:hypothetical protein LSAT2_006797 [Lamellibrachia satsuma]